MQTFFIPYKSSQIHCCNAGTGKQLLLCFHGYGESAETFGFLEKYLSADFTIVAIDLPLHGKTIWKEGLTFSPADLINIVTEIIQTSPAKNSRLYLAGYSLGGRVALHLLQLIPQKISKIVLLAPDGFVINSWYWLATQNFFGRRLFYFTMKRPAWLFLLLRIGERFNLVNQGILKFTNRYLHDDQARLDLYNRWISMRCFKPAMEKIRRAIPQNAIDVRLLYGKYDQVIRYGDAETFIRGIESHCTLSVINSGHEILKDKNSDEIVRLIKN